MTDSLMRSLIMLLTVLTMCTSCMASPKDGIKNIFESQKENGYGKVMKDSISFVMFNTKRIVCELQSKNPADTLRQDTVMVVPSKMHAVVQFLFFDEKNFQSNDTVYGKFDSWVCYKFEARKKQAVYLELDFGLRKWRLLNDQKKQIYAFDMKENSRQFLHLTRILFPEDKTLKLLDDNLNVKKK